MKFNLLQLPTELKIIMAHILKTYQNSTPANVGTTDILINLLGAVLGKHSLWHYL